MGRKERGNVKSRLLKCTQPMYTLYNAGVHTVQFRCTHCTVSVYTFNTSYLTLPQEEWDEKKPPPVGEGWGEKKPPPVGGGLEGAY